MREAINPLLSVIDWFFIRAICVAGPNVWTIPTRINADKNGFISILTSERGAGDFFVVEVKDFATDNLIVLVSFARDQY